jgi:hypothetical protein
MACYDDHNDDDAKITANINTRFHQAAGCVFSRPILSHDDTSCFQFLYRSIQILHLFI